MGNNGDILLSQYYRDAAFHVLLFFKKKTSLSLLFFSLQLKECDDVGSKSVCLAALSAQIEYYQNRVFHDSHHMLLPSIAHQQND